jgi:predicted dehydrogenase
MKSTKSSDVLKFGVVGLGNIAQAVHLPILWFLDNVEIVSVCDIYKSVAKRISHKYNTKWFVDYEKMLSEMDLDAVTICGPTNSHFPLSKLALETDVNIMLEHPISSSIEEARKLVEIEAKTSARVMIAYMMRYGSDVKIIEDLLNNGEIGEPYAACLTWFWSEHFPCYENSVHAKERLSMLEQLIRPKPNEIPFSDPYESSLEELPNVYIFNFGSHIINLICGLFGHIKDILSAYIDEEPRIDGSSKIIGKQSSAILRHNNGCLSTIVISDGARASIDKILQVQCTKGAVDIFSQGLPYPRRNRKNDVRIHTKKGHFYPFLPPTLSYTEEYRHFIQCLNTNTPFKTGTIDGLETIETIDRIIRTAKRG